MSFPATGMAAAYRNNLKDVARMLQTKHEDNYMVGSCCVAGQSISKNVRYCYGFFYMYGVYFEVYLNL